MEPIDWSAAHRRYNHRVTVSLLGLGLSLEEAEDVAQLAWTRLIERHLSGDVQEIRLPGLVLRQARFLALDHIRRKRVEQSRRAEVVELHTLPRVELDKRIAARQQLAVVNRALASCPPSSRRVFEEFSRDPHQRHAAIAERLGLSVQRVRQVLCETRKVLRLALQEEHKG